MGKLSRKELYQLLCAIVVALIVSFFIRKYLFTSYIVQGESMMPTLMDGNGIIVNKIDYHFSTPEHGDIIVFHYPNAEDFVKRVIGLPGDTIVYKDDQLYRNGKKVPEPYLDAYKKEIKDGKPLTADFTLEENRGTEKVPEGKLWVMGDNRRVSTDSRMFGFIDIGDVVGKVSFRYYPFGQTEYFSIDF